MFTHRKMVELPQLIEIVEKEKAEGKTIVFTNGCFDILHAGHVDLLQRGKDLGDDGKCLCLRARAATSSGGQESVQ